MSQSKTNYPFDIMDIDPSLSDQLQNYFNNDSFNVATTRFGPKSYLLPKEFKTIGTEIYNMEIRPTDTFVLSFPKSGTTWMQELVWLVINNFDYDKAAETPLNVRFPYIERPTFINSNKIKSKLKDESTKKAVESFIVTTDDTSSTNSRRFFKSHLPLSLLPPKLLDTCKVVYVARQPRDVVVSFYHYKKLTKMCSEDKDFKSFWELFRKDLIPYTPYFEHVKEAWQLRQHPNVLVIFYEELSKDLAGCIRQVAKFFNKEVTEEQTQKLCEHLNIDNFKKNKSINRENVKDLGIFNAKESFIRKGKVGGWRSYFDEDMTEQAERWIEENLRDTDLRYPQ